MLDWLEWRPLSAEETRQFLDDVQSRLPIKLPDNATLTTQYADLVFYRHFKLGWVRVSESNAPESDADDLMLLFSSAHFLNLDGSSTPIHEANSIETPNIAPQTVLDYVRFFCFFVYGDAGPFLLFESLPSACTGEGPVDPKCQELAAHIHPASLLAQTDSDALHISAAVLYDDSVFDAEFAVRPDGSIEMVDDNPLVSDVPPELQPPLPALYRGPGANVMPLIPTAVPPLEEATGAPQLVVPPSRKILETLVCLLLEQALITQAGHRLVSHFNARGVNHTPLEQFADLLVSASAVVAIESSIPFVEEVVSQVLAASGEESPFSTVIEGEADPSDETRLRISLPARLVETPLLLIPMHAYRGIADGARIAHVVGSRDLSVLIGCDRLSDIPPSLREIVDLTLRLPPLSPRVFENLFQKTMGKPLPKGWREPDTLWLSHVRHTDLEHPCSLNLSTKEALAYIRGRVEERLRTVDPAEGLSLDNLHGLGEARLFAEDLIADIHEAMNGGLPWSEVDCGVLLTGAPGTGKTTLARAIAKACGIKFISASAASWQAAGYLNDHIRAMRNDFVQARRYSPAILFIDEIDSIGNREALSGANTLYSTEVVNALLEQIQGIDASAPVIVIGATNHADRVDPALRRAGRLDRAIEIPYPSSEALRQIFEHYLQTLVRQGELAADVDPLLLGRMAFGMTGADIERIVRGAHRRARKADRAVEMDDLLAEITGKPADPNAAPRLTPEEVERVAVHEAGHALARCMSRSRGEDITFVSIVPRANGTLGFVALMPSERSMTTRAEYREYLEIALAGRAAEEIQYGLDGISSGAHDDLRKATQTAQLMVSRYGLGPDDSLLWTETPSDAHTTQAAKLLSESYAAVRDKLRKDRERLLTLAEALREKQELTGDMVLRITNGDAGHLN